MEENTPEENLQKLFETEEKLKEGTYKKEEMVWQKPKIKKFNKKPKKTQNSSEILLKNIKSNRHMENKYTYLFIGTLVGIVLILLLAWFFKEPPTISDCLRACEKEGTDRTEAWIRECGNACFREYGGK